MSRRGKTKSDPGRRRESDPAFRLPDDAVEALIARSRRCRTKGDLRRSLVLLREACALDEWRPRSWALLGAVLASLGRCEEAAQALRQARWLRLRDGDRARAVVLDRLLQGVTRAAA